MNRRDIFNAGISISGMAVGLRATQQDTSAGHVPSAASRPPLFAEYLQFWYETLRAIGAASYGGSEFGEVYVTASAIQAGNYDSWYGQWNQMAERVAREGASQLTKGHLISARESFLRAATYHRSRPSWMLISTDDRSLPPTAQRFMASRMGATVSEIASSHAAPVSQPEAVLKIIETAVQTLSNH